jgi:hypothetical protein
VAVRGAFEVIPRNFAAVVEIRARVLNSWASEADPSLVAAAVAIPEASEADPSLVAAAVAIPEASVVVPSFVVKVAVAVLVASEVVFASHPIAITVKPTLTSDCPQLTIVVD